MEFEVIDFVKANPVLYKRKYNTNKFKPLKAKKWRELGRLLKRDPNAVRLRWRSLRDNYRKQMNTKSKERRDGEDVLSPCNISKYYNHMTFLNSEYLDSPEHNNQSTVDEASTTIQSLYTKPVKIEIQEIDIGEDNSKHDASFTEVEEIPNINITMDSEEIIQFKKKRANKNLVITEACEEMVAIIQSTKVNLLKPSQTQVFFNLLAHRVQQAQMPAMDVMRLQQKIMELITLELMEHERKEYK